MFPVSVPIILKSARTASVVDVSSFSNSVETHVRLYLPKISSSRNLEELLFNQSCMVTVQWFERY